MVNLMSSRMLATLFSLLLLSGCQSSLRSNVVTFHDEPLPMGETIRVVTLDPDKNGSLQFRNYANLIREELRKIGYTPVDANENSELIAEVDYSVETGPTAVTVDPVDRYDRFARYHFYAGRYYDPFYFGIYDTWTPQVYSMPTYQRNLQLNIVNDDQDQRRIFEGYVQSTGSQNQLPEIMPYLITAMFSNFPGESGVAKMVTIDTDE